MRRIALAFALVACASPAFAVQDRYGPPRAEPAVEARMAPLPPGMLLDWHGKTAAPQVAPEEAAPQRPEPVAPWAQRLAPPQQSQLQPQPVAIAAPAPPPPPPAQRPAPPREPVQSQPVAISAPVPQQQARAMPPPVSAPGPYAGPPPIPTAQAPGAGERPRFYSVARQYGAQPDPIRFSPTPRGQALTLDDIPASANLGRTQAPLDDGRAAQAVPIPVTKQNAASNRISPLGL